MDLGIAERVAVVTGASRGIGRATAEALATEGVRLVLGARRAQGLDLAALAVRARGAEVATVAGDVTDPATAAALVAAAEREFGGVDILVNNAGGDSGRLPFDELDDAAWEHAYRLNVVSAVRLTRAVLPHMRDQHWGRVVTVSSYTGRVPEPFCGPYAAAKAAQINLTRTLSRSYGSEGVVANCVLPGLTESDGVVEGFAAASAASGRDHADLLAAMLRRAPIDVGRMGTPAEVAATIAFLCSEQAAWISGTSVSVDGGTVRSAP
ncbi:SDR family NAD(P)-dependent oxidoreductase [Pseudonocardia sp. NPDC049154]|uniref:SDR family NAD(P)-dependent oxidoreductase n=1 Tax=Pseudonocardia sp. NPDC049154 TaxID=3155501 RepID=UPI0033F5B4EC